MSSNKEQQSSTSKQSTTSSNSIALSNKQSAASNKRCKAKSHPSAAEDTRFDVITMPHDGYFRVNLEEPKVRNTFLKRFLPKYFKDLGYETFFWSLAYVDWIQDQQPIHRGGAHCGLE